MYQLYIFFMITDPKTTVRTKKGQMLTVFFVALAESLMRLMQFVHAPYYALFIVGPVANLIEIAADRRKRAQAAALAAMPTPLDAGPAPAQSSALSTQH
jgi:Na+-translocating ferredoxin:NAD+ oxidoreductase RnfD subunit